MDRRPEVRGWWAGLLAGPRRYGLAAILLAVAALVSARHLGALIARTRCEARDGEWNAATRTCEPFDLCVGEAATIACLGEHRDALAHGDQKRFWAIAWDAAAQARACAPPERAAAFLRVAVVPTRNAEFSEFLAEQVERLCVDHPACVRQAVTALTPGERSALARMLATPVILESGAIERAGCLGGPPPPAGASRPAPP